MSETMSLGAVMTYTIVQHEGGPPRADITMTCSQPACGAPWPLPEDVPLRALGLHAQAQGWSRHPGRWGLVCPEHTYRSPLAELEPAGTARKREASAEDTQAMPVVRLDEEDA